MAKTKPKINVSEAIRTILSKSPDAKPAEIVASLRKDHGVKISPQYVSTIKSSAKRKSRKPSADIEQLVVTKKFVKSVGGIDQAEQLLAGYRALFEN